jgi:hypothetical protein
MKKQLACLSLLLSVGMIPAFAADIVYVSFNGVDTNPCTRAAPCKTITHGLSLVAAGGRVDIVGSGKYDNFTVTQSVTVTVEPGATAIVEVAAAANGITVNAGSSDVVVLKGFTLNGHGSGNGIVINSATQVVVEECISRNFNGALVFTPSAPATLTVKGGVFVANIASIFTCCSAGGTASNVSIDGATLVLTGVSPSALGAINVDASKLTLTRSVLTGPGASGNVSFGIRMAHGTGVFENDSISGFFWGIYVDDTVFLSADTITGNGSGVVFALGTCFSRGNNTIAANGTDVSGGSLTPFSAQ